MRRAVVAGLLACAIAAPPAWAKGHKDDDDSSGSDDSDDDSKPDKKSGKPDRGDKKSGDKYIISTYLLF